MVKMVPKQILLLWLFFLVVFIFCLGVRFHVFILSFKQVNDFLPRGAVECHELSKCQLMPGDILIRKHATERTRLFEVLFNPYFTHTAFYYGDGQIIEAIGNESNSIDDVKMDNFLLSDWLTENLEGWIVVRPKIKIEDIYLIKNNLRAIVDNPNYTFGIGRKKTSCAELIFYQFVKNGIAVRDKNTPWVVTPDFLFQYVLKHPDLFVVVGYKFN